jgi:indolepyruvate ferredoxin oxidoreductase alpha subunit
MPTPPEPRLLSGDEAVALGALDAGVALGSGYPGTPSTEILEMLDRLGGPARWSPNEKVAYEVGMGVALAHGRALVVMKHVGLNVAADPFFASAYVNIPGAFVLVSADDPGMFSSQNEQDNRRYAHAAGVPMLEPADAQEAYDLTLEAFDVSHRWQIPVMLRMTTRVCHSKSVVRPRSERRVALEPRFERDIKGRVLLPAYARPAHRRLRHKLREMARWSEESPLNHVTRRDNGLGIIASGVASLHAREAAPDASLLKLGVTHPLPFARIRVFAESVARCLVVEEGDPYLEESIRAAGVPVEGKLEPFRFGELDVQRVRKLVEGDPTSEAALFESAPPQLCPGCGYREVFAALGELGCIVSGDIGCYTLAALPPFEAIDSTLCMGASIGVGLGMRHVLPDDQARRVVSVIGDSTFVHGGIGPLIEMMYNPPPDGHVVIVLDNGTTAMTGMQDHPGTGMTLAMEPTSRLDFEALTRAIGVKHVAVMDAKKDTVAFKQTLERFLAAGEPAVLIARRTCVLKKKRPDDVQRERG